MKRALKRMCFSLWFLVCFIFCSSIAFAADDLVGTVIDGSILTDDTESEGIGYSRARGIYLNYGTAHITYQGGGAIYISGSTVCHRISQKVTLGLYLEKLVNGNWYTQYILGPVSSYNTYSISNSHVYYVEKGYYYRVRGAHYAYNGSTEGTTSYTNGIYAG